ncbi:hypothetical protein G5C65_02445 [Streptomyces sp. SB3404]|uniref:Carrier domain-containing protein n=2 Tax=Streptomyces boncukensis TaxID=2711219 RepID=A0A6G4WRX3_9ACTN|nr:hypothetical protein [Streptomyces boncukensis]
MAARLPEEARARMARGGVVPLTGEQALAAFDAAVTAEDAALAAVRFDPARVRAGGVPPLLASVITAERRSARDTWAERYAGLPPKERAAAVLHLVRTEAAAVLGHPGPDRIDPDRPFTDAGFDSLAAVELSNALRAATGLALPATLLFDRPDPTAMAAYLHERLAPSAAPPVLGALDQAGAALSGLSGLEADDDLRKQVRTKLRALLTQVDEAERAGRTDDVAGRLRDATPDEVFAFLDQEFK